MIVRHNAILTCLAKELKFAAIPYFREQSVTVDRMGDLVLQHWRMHDDLYLDVSVVSSLCKSYRKCAARDDHGATKKRNDDKRRKYSAQINDSKILFQPMSVSVLGAWHPDAIRIYRKIGMKIAERNRDEVKSASSLLLTKLSFALQKVNSDMLATCYSV